MANSNQYVTKNGFKFKKRESSKENTFSVETSRNDSVSRSSLSGIGDDDDDDDDDFQIPTPRKKFVSVAAPRKDSSSSSSAYSSQRKDSTSSQNSQSSSKSSTKTGVVKTASKKQSHQQPQQPSIKGFIVKSQESVFSSQERESDSSATSSKTATATTISKTTSYSKPVAKVKPQISPTDAQRTFDVGISTASTTTTTTKSTDARATSIQASVNNAVPSQKRFASSTSKARTARVISSDDEDSTDKLFDGESTRSASFRSNQTSDIKGLSLSPPLDTEGLGDDDELFELIRGVETQHENPLFEGKAPTAEETTAAEDDDADEEEERRMLKEMEKQREMYIPDDLPDDEEEEEFDDDEDVRPLRERVDGERSSMFEDENGVDGDYTEDETFVPDDVSNDKDDEDDNDKGEQRMDDAPPSSPIIDDPSQFNDTVQPRRTSDVSNDPAAAPPNGKKPLFRSPVMRQRVGVSSSRTPSESSSSSPATSSSSSKIDQYIKYVESLEKIVAAVDEAVKSKTITLPSHIKIEVSKNKALKKLLGADTDLWGVFGKLAESSQESEVVAATQQLPKPSSRPRGRNSTSTSLLKANAEISDDDLFDDEVKITQPTKPSVSSVNKPTPSSKHKFAKDSSRSISVANDSSDHIDLTLDCSQTQSPSVAPGKNKVTKRSTPVLALPTANGSSSRSQSASTSSSAQSTASSSSRTPYVPPETPADDGPQFNSENYPHSTRLREIFKKTFGLKTFRKNQLSAINAALLGHDTFVLMPTGGGKSLCYQLPALVRDGVTVVLSPLKSLIQDQVDRLKEHRVKAEFLSSDLTPAQQDQVFQQLQLKTVEIKLLYITPEKLTASGRLSMCLENLYRRSLLTMFVIDEAHCVSQWGHDFRPDYKKLSFIREQYSSTPIMALTATATMRVRTDVLNQLRIKDAKKFIQSFNRTNLRYKVMEKKPKSITEQVIDKIRTDFRGKSGIVYCLSRKECDTLAKALKAAGIKAEAYHAGLTDNQRSTVQRQWVRDVIHVVCATIAFGMGIDKADVRYVIHFSLPKSIEGYYQESGRAGRDGDEATCILFYNYHDVVRMRRIIEMDNPNREAVKNHLNNLYRMVAYANDTVDCRRVIQLQYFGETKFSDEFCKKVGPACDNCADTTKCVKLDATDKAKEILKAVRRMTENAGRGYNAGKVTLAYVADVAKGASTQKIDQMGHKSGEFAHGVVKDWKKTDVERLLRHMVIQGYLKEDISITMHDSAVAYVSCGPRAGALFQNEKLEFSLRGSAPIASKSASSTSANSDSNRISSLDEDLRQECYNQLLQLVKTIAAEHDKSGYSMIYTNDTLREMSSKLPTDVDEFRKITGVTELKIETYGVDSFIEITQDFASAAAVRDMQRQDEEDEANSQGFSNAPNDEFGGSDDDLDSFGNTSGYFNNRGGGGGWKGRGRGGRGGYRNKYAKGGFKRKRAAGSSQGGGAKRQRTSSATRGTRYRGRGASTAARGKPTVSADGYLSAGKSNARAGGSGSVGLLAPPAPKARRPDLGF